MTQRKRTDAERRKDEREQRKQAREQQAKQSASGTEFSPPPYEVPETPLERLGPGFGYLALFLVGGFVLNLVLLGVIAGNAGG